MTERLALKCSDKIISFGVFAEEKRLVLKFGLELLFSSIIGVVIIVFISLIAGHPLLWIFFLASFIPLRTTAGGYHAPAHWSCNIVFAVTFFLCLTACKYILFPTVIPLFITAFSAVIIAVFSPVEAKNKPLNNEKRRKNRIKSLIYISADVIIAIIFLILNINDQWVQMYFLGIFAATVSQIAALIINKKGESKDESKT